MFVEPLHRNLLHFLVKFGLSVLLLFWKGQFGLKLLKTVKKLAGSSMPFFLMVTTIASSTSSRRAIRFFNSLSICNPRSLYIAFQFVQS